MKSRIKEVEMRECACSKIDSMLVGKALANMVKKYYKENPKDYEKVCKEHDQLYVKEP